MRDEEKTRKQLLEELESLRRQLASLSQRDVKAERLECAQRLALGLAQRLNNILTPILGYAQLGERVAGDGDHLKKYFRNIGEAASTAAALTSHLLAFSARQAREPALVDLNQLVREMAIILRFTLGPGITLELDLAPELWSVRADQKQLEQALMHLTMNARDAMPEGGRVVIATSNVSLDGPPPGDYVALAVTDEGTGMTAEVRAKLFEPFFSTRQPWERDGLGLAVCYGVMSQNGGHMEVDSQPGEGATVRSYLPRALAPS